MSQGYFRFFGTRSAAVVKDKFLDVHMCYQLEQLEQQQLKQHGRATEHRGRPQQNSFYNKINSTAKGKLLVENIAKLLTFYIVVFNCLFKYLIIFIGRAFRMNFRRF